MKKLLSISLCFATFSFVACNSGSSENSSEISSDSLENVASSSENMDLAHNSQNSVDWQGTYIGTIPCADCPGIETSITLNNDSTFQYMGEYLERDAKIEDNGTFIWFDNGGSVELKGKEINIKLKVGENQLFYLDQQGKRIEGELSDNYILKKQ